MFDIKTVTTWKGRGINHDNEAFNGIFTADPLTGKDSFSLRYRAIRANDQTQIHDEIGLLARDEDNNWSLYLHMEELPCATVHSLQECSESRWVFAYHGSGSLAGFSSELVFEFSESGFRYLHRWAMGGEVSDKSWCDLIDQKG